MLSIGVIKRGQEEYYLNLAAEDYYVRAGEGDGIWMGAGAEALGLRGTVTEEALRYLLNGFSPDGSTKLVQNAGDEKRVPGYDLTLSSTKSMSVAWAVGDRKVREAIERSHESGARAAVRFLENTSVYTRVGKGGRRRVCGKLVVAAFAHGTSRAQDPQLHTHLLVMNAVVRPDGGVGAIVGRELFAAKMAAGAIYRAEVAAQLERRLGLRIERVGSCFEVAGVPKELRAHFSKRRRMITSALADRAVQDAKAAARAAIETRQPKQHMQREELRNQWRLAAEQHGFGQDQVRGLLHRQQRREDLAARAAVAVREGLMKITERQSHFTERDLIRYTAEAGQDQCLGGAVVEHVVSEAVRRSEQIVPLGVVRGDERYTTRENLELEKRLLTLVESSRNDTRHIARRTTVAAVLAERPTLTDEQRKAIEHITHTPGAVKVLSGLAGTGKTFALAACREVFERENKNVIGACLSGKAAVELERSAGISSATIHSRIRDLEAGRMTCNSDTVLVVDEAGMAGTRQTERLAREVVGKGGLLILAGDARQLQPIEAGGPFQGIGKRIGQAEMHEITRQREEWAREAVKEIVQGDAAKVLGRYVERDMLTVAENRREARQRLVEDWRRLGGVESPADHLALTSSRLEAAILNEAMQGERMLQGKLSSRSVAVGGLNFHEGDRVLFTRNNPFYDVRNGQIGTVLEADEAREKIVVELDGGKRVSVYVAEYQHLRMGYAVNTHKAQSMTAELVYVLVEPLQDREMTYVQLSRARGNTRLYMEEEVAGPELTEVARQVSRSHQKQLAHDIAVQQQTAPRLGHELGR